MSVSEEVFLIVGCDIKDCVTDKFEDWYWSDEGERYSCNAEKGHIHIIEDGMCGNYTYFGYIAANIKDHYSIVKEEIDIDNFNLRKKEVENGIKYLADIGVLDKNKINDLKIKMILFVHCS